MISPTPTPPQYRIQRWLVRRGPLIAAVVITAGVAAKTLSLIFAILGLPLTQAELVGVLATVDQVPWPVAIFLLLASWMTVFLGVPLWLKYLSYEYRWRRWDAGEPEDERRGADSSRGARTKRSQ
ncbi:hypothetical protein [Dichotomicrobium thermohalophilum]|uniref:Uncharacterized protein n=1 Tax=Dichotomicrobium thermohalophilum TaxID=933063 RepID=A0A397QAH0_9HYPH|nr:hypothetical protein [Dichotomicrobium thermohalophilum]RIA55221.1 hypothetical protein BXY53_0280 [Dichotomicrobium thermohalophilum]